MRLLFLDLDGCLNCHEWDPEVLCGQIHKDKVQLLNGILRATDARIVLSSAWRYLVHRGEMNLMGLEWLLRSHGILADRLIGITRQDTLERSTYDGVPGNWPVDNERGQQITEFLRHHAFVHGDPEAYVALDDMDPGITAAGHPLVLCDGATGLTEREAKRCIKILKGQPC